MSQKARTSSIFDQLSKVMSLNNVDYGTVEKIAKFDVLVTKASKIVKNDSILCYTFQITLIQGVHWELIFVMYPLIFI